MNPIITNSRLAAHRRCHRYHHVRYNLGYRPIAKDADLFFGSLVHKGLEAWWTTGNLEDAYAAMRAEKADPFERAKAEVMLCGYDARWEWSKPLGVEVEFNTPLPGSGVMRLAGKVDAITEIDGKVFIVEHKTSSQDISPGADYWRRLRLDGQISVYYDGVRSLGHEVHGVIYDVLGKPRLRPKASESQEEYAARCAESLAAEPDKYFQRQTVVRLESELEAARKDVAEQVEILDRTTRNPENCLAYNKLCPYFSVCCGEASLDNSEHFTQSNDFNPELSKC